jgi:hypothetical protein
MGAGSWLDRWLLRRSRLIVALAVALFASALGALYTSDRGANAGAKLGARG